MGGTQPFGTVAFMRNEKGTHTMEAPGVRCIMPALRHNHPTSTLTLRNLKAGEIVCRQGVSWHPLEDEKERLLVGRHPPESGLKRGGGSAECR